eukprot:gene22637-34647_t
MTSLREISRCTESVGARNCGGVGHRTHRVVGERTTVGYLDPICCVEQLKKKFAPRESGPLPWTPFYGMIRIVYIISGGLQWTARHQTKGDRGGVAESGDVYCLHAKSGAMVQEEASQLLHARGGILHTFEIWIREPNSESLKEPLVDTYQKRELPRVEGKGWEAKVLLGTFSQDGTEKPAIETATPSVVINFSVFGGNTVNYELPEHWNVCVYVYEGEVEMQANMKIVGEGTLVVFEQQGTMLEVWAKGGDAGAVSKFLVVAAAPHNEMFEQDGTILAHSPQAVEKAKHKPGFREALTAVEQMRKQYAAEDERIKKSRAPPLTRPVSGSSTSPRPTSSTSPRPTEPCTPLSPSSRGDSASVIDLRQRLDALNQLKRLGTPGLDPSIHALKKQLDEAVKKDTGSGPNIEAEMKRYDAEFKQYSAQWVTYLQ